MLAKKHHVIIKVVCWQVFQSWNTRIWTTGIWNW